MFGDGVVALVDGRETDKQVVHLRVTTHLLQLTRDDTNVLQAATNTNTIK